MKVKLELGQAFVPLFTNTERVLVFDGNRGSAKTRSILSALMCRALEHPRSTWALWRSTRTRLTDTVLKTLETQVFPAFGMDVPGAAGASNRSHYRLPNGSTFVPVGLDDIHRGTSAEFAGGYLNEGIEIDTLEEVEALMGTLREASVPFNQLIIDTNPGPPAHWLNQKAEHVPNALRRLPATRQEYDRIQQHNRAPARDPLRHWKRIICGHEDNPGYFELENWRLTPLGQRYVNETLAGLSGHLKRRWLNREWAAASGAVFPEFDADVHVIRPFKVPSHWPCWWFHDAGLDHPAANLLLCRAPNGRALLIDEWYGGGRHVPEHAAWIKSRNPGRNVRGYYADPRGCFQDTEQGVSVAKQFAACGLNFQKHPAKQGVAVQNQVELVHKALTTKGADNKPMFQIFDTCTGTVGEMQTWGYKRTPKGELPTGDDAYEDKNNHAIDCLLGFFAKDLRFEVQAVRPFHAAADDDDE